MFVKKFLALRYCLLVLLCGAAMLSLATQSHAVVLRAENFDSYPNNQSLLLNGSDKWQLQSGTPLEIQVVAGQAVLLEDGLVTEDLRMTWAPFGDPNAPGDIYFGLDFSVTGTAPFTGSDTEYFAHFFQQPFSFNTRFDVVAPNDPNTGDFSVGIASDDSTADAIWATDLTFGVTYRAIARYDQTINQAELWINPVDPNSVSILGDDKPDPGDHNDAFGLRQSGSSYGETIRIDNIVIGTTFADALSLVPEPASLVLMLVGLTGLVIRRRL